MHSYETPAHNRLPRHFSFFRLSAGTGATVASLLFSDLCPDHSLQFCQRHALEPDCARSSEFGVKTTLATYATHQAATDLVQSHTYARRKSQNGSFFDNQRKEAIRQYKAYVSRGINQPFSGKILQQTYLGDSTFIDAVQEHISLKQSDSIHITKRSKKSPKQPIDEITSKIEDRGEAMNAIYKTGHYTMFEIAAYFHVHYSTVSRAIRLHCKMR